MGRGPTSGSPRTDPWRRLPTGRSRVPTALPTTIVRRYSAALAAQWERALPVGDAVEDVEVGTGGTVLLAGSHAPGGATEFDGLVARLTASGSIDTTFDGDGRLVLAATAGRSRSFVDIDDDGAVVAAVGIDAFESPDS